MDFSFLQLDFRRFRRSSCGLLGRVMQHRPRASLTRYEASSVFPSLGGIWTSEDPLLAVTKAGDRLAMRPEVQAFVADGTLPGWEASEGEVDRRDQQLGAIARPVTREEAKALVSCFGPDDCYGVAWTLLHLIETGPNPLLTTAPGADVNEWHQRLYDRAVFGGLLPGI
ncbi:hypothetical protein [Actinacidiphila glaucinigra]|uniref:hypothetical protein n=1 Tax=Actinacidiphila glaucinigra TaxID=235986 RepID=UPI00366EF2B1